MAITTFAELQTAVSTWLNHDVSTDVATIIQLAEGRLARDRRIRSPTCRGTWTITTNGDDQLPDDFGRLVSWYHDGPVYYFPIELVADLGKVKSQLSLTTSGVPRYATNDGGRINYAPEPSQSFTTKMSYLQKITPLSGANPTNWLLTDHPDIYLFACLVEAEPYLRNPEMAEHWRDRLEEAVEALRLMRESEEYGGGRIRRFHKPIGG